LEDRLRHERLCLLSARFSPWPGVGAIFIGAAGDLHQWLGVPIDSPEVEAARQTILASCKAHNVARGITAIAKADVDWRLNEGWKMIRTGRVEDKRDMVGEERDPRGFLNACVASRTPRSTRRWNIRQNRVRRRA
jgi:hypothetical protein